MRRAGRVISRTTILNSVWDSRDNVEQNTLDAFVSSLRSKIDQGRTVKLLHTVRGMGYMIREGQ